MRILLMDDEQLLLDDLYEVVKEVVPDAEIKGFKRASQLLAYAEEHPCDVAFLDIHMRGMNGIDLAKYLKELNPTINIIFVTAYSEYKGDAMDMHASGYITKPVTADKIRLEMKELRYQVTENKTALLKIKCFGSFEIMDMNGKAIHFERSRARELMAYLVDKNGDRCTTRELIGVLFGDAEYTTQVRNHFQHIVSSMMKSLRNAGAEEAVKREYQYYAIDTELVDCDYYRYKRMDRDAINAYFGEYMSQYSWAQNPIEKKE